MEAGADREVPEAFLAEEVVFREAVTISLEVKEVFPEVAAVSPVAIVLLIAAVSLMEAVVSPEAKIVFRAVETEAFPETAAVIFHAEAAAVPLDPIEFRTILRCSPISAARGKVAVECRRVRPEIKPAVLVYRWEEALHNYLREIDPRRLRPAMKAAWEHVRVMFHPNV